MRASMVAPLSVTFVTDTPSIVGGSCADACDTHSRSPPDAIAQHRSAGQRTHLRLPLLLTPHISLRGLYHRRCAPSQRIAACSLRIPRSASSCADDEKARGDPKHHVSER